MTHFKNYENPAAVSYVAIQSEPAQAEPEEKETVWDYIRNAAETLLFFAAGVCAGTMLAFIAVVA